MIEVVYTISENDVVMASNDRGYMLKWTDFWKERGYALFRRYANFKRTRGGSENRTNTDFAQLESISIGDGIAYIAATDEARTIDLARITIYNPRGIARILLDD